MSVSLFNGGSDYPPRSIDELREDIFKVAPEFAPNAIHSEDFTQWVLEDNFVAPMPDLSMVGAQFVSVVAPYEEAKIRILNGGHTALC